MIVRQSCAAVHCYHIVVMLDDSQCGVAEVFSLGLGKTYSILVTTERPSESDAFYGIHT